MWIVRLALRRPYTFVVAALLIAILGGAAIATLPVDIFPYIDLPVVSVVWQYNGLTPEEMESRIVTNFERALTANVVGIEHIESQSHQTVAVVRVYFHPGTSVDLALSQKGVCRHRAFAFLVTALGLGIPARMVINEAHAWVEVLDPGEDAGSGANGGGAGSQQRGQFAVDVGVIVDDSRRLILAVRADGRLGRVDAVATVRVDDA